MWFGYHSEIIEKYPEINSAVIWVESFDNSGHHPVIEALLVDAENRVRERCPDRAAISQQPQISAWRAAYSRMGLKPNRYPCATEQLMRRVVDGNPVPRISAIVDLGNAVALSHMITVAPFDTARIAGGCEVRHAKGDERYWAINADTPDEIPQGEVIFADETPDVISRRWAWRQSDKGKITPETTQLVIVAEAMHDAGAESVSSAGELIASTLRDRFNAPVKLELLSRDLPRSDR